MKGREDMVVLVLLLGFSEALRAADLVLLMKEPIVVSWW